MKHFLYCSIIIAALFFASPINIFAGSNCELIVQSLALSLLEKSDLVIFLNSRGFARLKETQPQEFRQIGRELVKQAKLGGIRDFEVNNERFNLLGEIEINSKNELVVSIRSFQLISREAEEISFRQKPKNLNLGFSRFIVAMLEAVESLIQEDKKITRVQFVAETVVHPELEEKLISSGFESPKISTLLNPAVLALKIGPKGLAWVFQIGLQSKAWAVVFYKAAAIGRSQLVEQLFREGIKGTGRSYIIDVQLIRP